MTRIISGNYDNQTVDDLNYNFKEVSGIETKVIEDLLEATPANIKPDINGAERIPSGPYNNSTNYGANFIAEVNGIIHATWVFASASGKMGFGLVEQDASSLAGAQIAYKELNLTYGWNRIILNFPVEQGIRYTLFKRHLAGQSVNLRQDSRDGWQSNPSQWLGRSLTMMNGRFIDRTGNWLTIFFFEIEVISNLVEVYKIMNESVNIPNQFYVGQNPPSDAQFWFRPVGG